jgi:diadenosine tetraphosphate (Ap4A) HIT family hydrolase
MSPQERLDQLVKGESPQLVSRMASGFAVMSDTQFLPGYCLLLAYPMTGQLNDLQGSEREQFLRDMARLGDAVKSATGAARINYSIYGNLDPFLHAHVFPRFADEDAEYRTVPPFLYPAAIREAEEHRFDPTKHGALLGSIRSLLEASAD